MDITRNILRLLQRRLPTRAANSLSAEVRPYPLKVDRTLIPYANYPRLQSAADVERIAASSITVGTPRTKDDCNRTS